MVLFLSLSIVKAQIPRLITVQGRLLDSSSSPVTTPVSVIFKIFDDPTVGNELWSESRSITPDSNGIFNIILGSVTPLDIPFDEPTYLEVNVEGEVLSPRYSLTALPYGFRGIAAENLSSSERIYVQPESSLEGSYFYGLGSAQSLYLTGDLGIGISLPASRLHVVGTPLIEGWDSVLESRYATERYQLIGSYWGWDKEAIYIAGYNKYNSQYNTSRVIVGGPGTSVDLRVGGNLRAEGLVNCDTIDTDALGNFVCGTDDAGAGGTVTSIAAGSGLTASPLDPITTAGTLNVGAGQGITVNANDIQVKDCAANQILKRNSGDTDWVCAADADSYPGNCAADRVRVAGTCRLIPDCDADTQTLNYDQSTDSFSCGDDDVGITSESDTLQTVTSRGASTSNTILAHGFAGPRVYIDTGPGTGADDQTHTATCPNGYAMTGFSVYISTYWDGELSAKCAKIAGLIDNTDQSWTSGSGDDNDAWHSASCGSGYIATGIRAYASSRLDTDLALRCTKVTVGSTQLTGAGYTAWPTADVNHYTHWSFCVPGSFMRYVQVWASTYMDNKGTVECTTIYP